jgi:hypothetical protein
MPLIKSEADELNNDQLKSALRLLIEKILDNRHGSSLNDDRKEEIIDEMLKAIRKNKPSLTRGEIVDPTFIKKLTLALTMMISNDKLKVDEIMKKIFKLFTDKGLDLKKLLKMSPKEIAEFMKKNLTPDEQNKLNAEFKNLAKEFLKDMEKTEGIKLEPRAFDPAVNQLEKDISANIFSLLTLGQTGSIAVPVLVYLGGGQIQTDFNPEMGTAFIDQKNKIDYSQGDSQGLESSTVLNYFAIPETMVDELKDVLYEAGVAPGPQPPKLTA